ncbi:hypothetical protein phiCbK_036 [Caulobacter phage phiCbK]|uniref:Uncharacterized protein n=5 Tax=Viruses TaxID=10239 RepID=K4K466_9CAUD|nr:hypothetical protein D865_gp133 [Caulobacter phage phiCbK]ARB14507.1 hypothetical protein Ccr5_gp287 [Caulobacter phage Ccr5]ARB15198.1 hypothetical protein Ccr32_gp280 [Caulobacter phage Ccr32]ARB15532.1 hypothetical protein Ccr34_gp290 [Caulobacter phage Ccr34]AFO71550.1 hypothetical protein phiCbK_036 [Caulobacter phage phiCbK]AFU87117.1 hypothetical protein CbK_gp285 [Caulobacter phage phiCbK]
MRQPKKTEQAYIVSGTWPFPSDMLRYDDARPATEGDANLIKALESEDPSLSDLRNRVQIKLIRPANGLPAVKRWESFLWKVVGGDEEVAADVAWRDALDNRDALRKSGLAKLTPAERAALNLDIR